MKFVLYKFPDVVRFDESGGNAYVVRKEGIRRNKNGVPCEIVDVVYGNDIDDVTDELIRIVQDEMYMAYGRQSDVYGPNSECDTLSTMTDDTFDYEMNAISFERKGKTDKMVDIYFGVKECAE